MITIPERITPRTEYLRKVMDSLLADIRVSSPGIIQSFNKDEGTVEVQLTIKEQRQDKDGKLYWEQVPLLVDVPSFVLTGGDFSITTPIKKGDECLVVFGDTGMDWWWQNGGIQQSLGTRRHDLSDGFAIVGFRSLPNLVSNYSTSSLQIRNKDKSVMIEITDSAVNIEGTTIDSEATSKITVNAPTVDVKGTNINITGETIKIGSLTTIDNKNFLLHSHSGVHSGTSTTGPVV